MNNSSAKKNIPPRGGFASKLAGFRREKSGVVSIESALVFPFMVMLLLGAVDISYYLSLKRKVTVAASAIVDLTTQETVSVSTSALDGYIEAADAILKPFSSTNTHVEIINYRRSGDDVGQAWSHSRGGCGGSPPGGSASQLASLTEEENDIVMTRVCISFQPIVGYIAGIGSWQVQETVKQRPRNGLTLDCSNC